MPHSDDPNYDPRQTGGDGSTPPSNTDPTSGESLDDAIARLRPIYEAFFQQHPGLEKWGSVDDALKAYKNYRSQGLADIAAREALTTFLRNWYSDNSPGQVTPVTPTGGGGGGGGNKPPANSPTPYTFPSFDAPGFTPSTPFSYPDFHVPTLDEAKNQPGYQFGVQQGQDAILTKAAQLGVARGGGTLKDLFNYTNAAGEQNYGNVFNQDLSAYNTNRGNAFDTWAANNSSNLANDTVAFRNAAATFNPKFQASTLSFQDMYNRWRDQLDALTRISTAGAA